MTSFACIRCFESGWVKQLCSLLPLKQGLRKEHFMICDINRWLTGYPRARCNEYLARNQTGLCYWYTSCRGSWADAAEAGGLTPLQGQEHSSPFLSSSSTHAVSHPHQLPPLLSNLLVIGLTFLLQSSSSHSSSASCQLRVRNETV